MPSIQIQPFLGTVPKSSANLLPDGAGQIADNVKLMSGELRSWRSSLKKNDVLADGAKTIYRLYHDAFTSRFLSWATDVDVIPSPLSDSIDHRIYYTGDDTPRKTNYALATSGPAPFPFDYLEMGVPAPTISPTMAVTINGFGTVEDRAYLVTFVSTFGALKEESQPILCKTSGLLSTISVSPVGATIQLTNLPTAPAGKYNITHKRIYRTNIGTSDYGFLAEIPIADTTYDDSQPTGVISTILNSVYYSPPPVDLIGIVSMPNGMVAGFRKDTNEVWFCEPYFPHAWPAKYSQTVFGNVVGLGVYGSTLVVMTDLQPFIISGIHPAAVSVEVVQINEPCIAKRSIANDEYGVIYASPNGLVGIGPSAKGLISEAAYTLDDWRKLNPSGFFGNFYGHDYIAFNSLVVANKRTSIIMRRDSTYGVTTTAFPAAAFYIDRPTGTPYAVSEIDNRLYQLDADEINNDNYTWQSRIYAMQQMVNFKFLQVDADFNYLIDFGAIKAVIDEIKAQNLLLSASGIVGSFNTSVFGATIFNGTNLINIPHPVNVRNILVTIIGDGVVRHSVSITSPSPYTMPSGYKAYNWEVRINGNVPVKRFAMSTSLQELKVV